MPCIDFISPLHKSTKRDYIARVTNTEFPKPKAAELAKQWDFDYWDGDRRICYGGYSYREGYWEKVAQPLVDHYQLRPGQKVLDVGCGKGFLLYDLTKVMPGLQISGIDISKYAVANAKKEIQNHLQVGSATKLPYPDDYFDLVLSITTLHNLHNYDLDKALREIERVSKNNKYICVESYRNEQEKANLLYWQVTCEAFCTPEEWQWWFEQTGYTGDYSLIFFE